MDVTLAKHDGSRAFPWRLLAWGTAGVLMLAAAVARFATPLEFAWTASDFVAAAILLGTPCLAFEGVLRVARGNTPYILAAGLAIGTAFLTVLINLAVGIIGDEDDAANWAFVAVLVIALSAALLARLRPRGLSRGMVAAAIAQALVAAYAAAVGSPEGMALSLVFTAAWLASAWLFARAAREMAHAPTAR